MKKLLAIPSAIAGRWLSAVTCKIAIVGMLAASIAVADAASYSTGTVGPVNGNNLAFTAATGNSDSYATFTNNLANAFATNSGGVWNFDGAAFTVNNAETITLSCGTSQSSNLVLTTAFNGSDKAKQRTQAVYCMNNLKQLGLAWVMYADDNADKIVNLNTYFSDAGDNVSQWVAQHYACRQNQ